MIIIDKLLIGGVRFVLDKVAQAADAELNDESRLREELLAAQMRLELGEISEQEFADFEAEILPRMRSIRERKLAAAAASGDYKVIGVEASLTGDHRDESDA